MVSAPAGVTDALLGLAKRAAAGDGESGAKEIDDLRARYLEILRGAARRGTKEVAAEIDRSMDELERLLSSLAVLKELTPRTRDFIVSRGERLSARLLAAALGAAGVRARYVDATEVVFTDGPFGGASPNLMLTDLAGAQGPAPALRGRADARSSRASSAPPRSTTGTATTGTSTRTATLGERSASPRSDAAAPT